MFEYTHSNYYSFGYDDETYNTRQNENSVFWCNFSPAVNNHGSFHEECIKAAKLIRSKTSDDLYVLFSGGMDSELVLRSFIDAGIEVNAITVEFEGGLNEHDILWSRKFCQDHQINHIIKKLNIEDFWKNSLFEYASAVQCNSPQFPVTMWLVDQTPGFPIIGSGDSDIRRKEGTNNFVFNERENYLTLYMHFVRRQREGVPAFFQYTPELLLSFFEDPILQKYRDHQAKEEDLIAIVDFKYHIYENSFPGLENRIVYNGFEKIEDRDQFYRKILRDEKCPGAGQCLQFNFDQFVEGLKTTGCHKKQRQQN